MKKTIIVICLMFLFCISSPPDTLPVCLMIICNDGVVYDPKVQKYEKEFTRFINHLGRIESGNDWTIINDHNCLGEWQFGVSTLRYLGYGYITTEEFKKDPSIFPRNMQLQAVRELIKVNEKLLIPYKKYIGTNINGVRITKSGLLGGMHLGGLGSVKRYLESNGEIDKKDANGSKISNYIKQFSIYYL